MSSRAATLGNPAGRGGAPPSGVVRAILTALLALPAALAALSPQLTAALETTRAGLASGEAWRLVTGHWTHWSADHLTWDLAAFAVLTFLALRRGVARTLLAIGAAAVAIGGLVWLAQPGLAVYRGLSGIDSALYVLVAVDLLRTELRGGSRGLAAVFALALAGFLAKVGAEVATGAAVFVVSEGFVPVPVAHLAGAAVGVGVALAPGRRTAAQLPFRASRRGVAA